MSKESKNNKQSDRNELVELINSRIEKLRPKLLDLGRRNPLLSTKFSDRSHSHVRVVDELPQVLFDKLIDSKMCFTPLPPLERDPKDENTTEFQKALADARITDQSYIEVLDKIDQDSDDSANQLAIAERELKDRLRVKLGMHPHQTKTDLSLVQHAKNNDILPFYDLPLSKDKNPDGRHVDDIMQTLLLPDFLQKKLNSLMQKHKTWTQETGINVLRAAFGFLEWTESSSSKTCLAPLILLPIEIEKKKTRHGFQYWVTGQGDSPEINTVLMEKFRLDFGIELPDFDIENPNLENYFKQVGRICKKEPSWRIRRQVALGVFPSARMAMYHDLDTKTWDFTDHNVIKELLGTSGSENSDTPFGDEYEIDDPSIEVKVPFLVMDADSSQHSVIVDIVDNKNIAVEGPPGTGKSQTIVNTIATALYKGKKILFVAEKMAALEVVRSRLEACGLGEFLLTLQANRSSKEQVIRSIRDRLSPRWEKAPEELDEKIHQFKRARTQINKYIKVISSTFADTTFTVHEILGWGIKSHNLLNKINLQKAYIDIPGLKNINKGILDELYHLCDQVEACWKKVKSCQKWWQYVKAPNIDPYTAEGLLRLAKKSAELYKQSIQQRKHLSQLSLDNEIDKQNLSALKDMLKYSISTYNELDIPFIKRVGANSALKELKDFFAESEIVLNSKDNFSNLLVDPLKPKAPQCINDLANAISEIGIENPSETEAIKIIETLKKEINSKRIAKDFIIDIAKLISNIKESELSAIVTLANIAASVSKSVLSLRCDILSTSDAREFILKSERKCQKLLAQQKQLEEVFCAVKSIRIEELEKTLDIFVSSGFFSIFSPKFYNAKRFFRSIAKSKKFNKEQAIHQIRELKEWIGAVKEFESNKNNKALLGKHFDGLETDFKPFIQLVNFYGRIDDELKGADNIQIRKHLQGGELSSIANLPQIDVNHPIRVQQEKTYDELVRQISKLEKKLKLFAKCKKNISEHSKLLKQIENINAKKLSELSTALQDFQSNWEKLSTNSTIAKVFGDEFHGPTMLSDTLKPSITLLDNMELSDGSIAKALLKSLESNQMSRDLEIISSAIEKDVAAEESLSELTSAISVDDVSCYTSLRRKELTDYLLKSSMDKEGLLAYSQYYSATLELSSNGYGPLLEYAMTSSIELKDLSDTLNALIGQALAKEVYAEFGNTLASYTGIKLNHLRKRLAELDREILNLSKQKLRTKLRKEAQPPSGSRTGRRSEWTDMALLRHEITKRTRYIPARDLTMRAGEALLELKPCWMMSPLAVAQYIEKEDIAFDLLIIDEASQMTPENALGAISRSEQTMIVGDTNQLPPTSFFKKYIDNIDDEEEEVLTEESILEMANSVFRSRRRLKWHYRSKHPGLIAFSNKYVYDNGLTVFPSPDIHEFTKCVSFCKVKGLYANGTNPIEASQLASAAIDFMHKHKNMSLGIVLLNLKQRDLIIDEMEYMISQDAVVQDYIECWETKRDGLESFFIKNLENVQGDERDVIFIGTVYGPEKEKAPVMQRFGPINGINGKRRLNVLFTRAKHKIVTFSSMTASDIRVDGHSNEGVALLKYWLEYCASGKILTSEIKGKEPCSIFEEYVIDQLKSIGCQPVSQVGVTGYFIDIGVKHPKWPHGFIMGVECDGATYHRSKSARDRDRLRQEVLESLGWHLYRIWSTDWFADPLNETEKLRTAIEHRLKELHSRNNDLFQFNKNKF